MALAMTRMAITSDRADWTIIVSLAHRRTGRVSVGLNAVALQRVQVVRRPVATPPGASSGVAFSGKAKLGATGEPAARSAGPPRRETPSTTG